MKWFDIRKFKIEISGDVYSSLMDNSQKRLESKAVRKIHMPTPTAVVIWKKEGNQLP